mgnify:CR=1 FL=1
MSVVFGGKLLSQKGQNAVDVYDDPNYGIKLLSKREKALLAELDRTRSEIVSELFTLGPSVSTENLEDWHNTINTYESQIHDTSSISKISSNYKSHKKIKKTRARSQPLSKKLTTLKCSSSSTFHEGKTVTALDFLPALTTDAATSLGSSTRRGGGSSHHVKLPVLSLPSIRTKISHSISPRALINDNLSPYNTLSDFVEFTTSDLTSGTSYIVLGDLDRYYIQQYLDISNEQMDEILQDLDAILVGDISTGDSGSSSPHPSVFNAVKDAGVCDHFRNNTQSASSPHLSAASEMAAFGGTIPLTDAYGSSKSSLGLRRPSKHLKTNKNKCRSNGRYDKGLTQKNRKTKMAWPDSGVNDLNSLDSLRSELVKSLGNMQHHTAEVRESE